jgi:glycerol-3-phosphate acyltransferase PlsY
MLLLIAAVVAAYLLGSLSGSLLLGRLYGVDIRRLGSGNAGGTNALRSLGWRFALGVVAIDIGKGAAAAWFGAHLHAAAPAGFDDAFTQGALCGFAAMVGHCWPLYFGFRGGKGAASAAGAIAVLMPALLVPVLIAWVLVLVASGYVGLATVVAAGVFAASALLLDAVPAFVAFAGATALLIVFTHRGNLARLRHGNEHRFEQARLLARLRRRR